MSCEIRVERQNNDSVDQERILYEFDGCFYHGCHVCFSLLSSSDPPDGGFDLYGGWSLVRLLYPAGTHQFQQGAPQLVHRGERRTERDALSIAHTVHSIYGSMW